MAETSASTPGTTHEDPVLSAGRVLEAVRRHVPTAREVTGIDESGRKGRAYLIDADVVLKTHRPVRLRSRVVEEFETSLEKEHFFLRQMGQDREIRAPAPLGYGQIEGVEYVCMTRAAGVKLRRADPGPDVRRRALLELGRNLRRIHSLPQQPFAEAGLFPIDGAGAELRTRIEAVLVPIAAAVDALPDEWRPGLVAGEVAARALASLPDTDTRVALHSNPAPEHIFVDPDTGALSCLIDFGDAYISHPALDLRPWRDPADRAAVFAGYTSDGPVDDAFVATWRVGLVLGELAALLRRRQPPAASEARLRELLSEM